MKALLSILFLLFIKSGFSQKTANSSEITDPAVLSRQLTASLSTERDKVKAIFHWITDNIAYPRVQVRTLRRKGKQTVFTTQPVDDDGPLPPLSDRVAMKVLKDREAVCEGYARLFQSLCEHAGIRSEIITGYARTDMSRIETRFRSNHSWNAVFIDSTWYLLDATWASGYILMPSGEFVKRYDSYYFLTPPEDFNRHHYPDDLRWTLLAEPPSMAEFKATPFRQRSFYKYSIKSFFPSAGIIEARVGDTLRFEIERLPGNVNITPDSLWDSASLVHNPMYAYILPDASSTLTKIFYQYPVDSEDTQWVHVMFNNDAVLRYRLNIIRDKKTAGFQQ